MTELGSAPSGKRRSVLAVSIKYGTLCVLGALAALFARGFSRGQETADANQQIAAPLLRGLSAYMQEQATCPARLDDLVPAHLLAVPTIDSAAGPRPFAYSCSGIERRFFLAFADGSGRFVPSDLYYEYDSLSGAWALKDHSEVEAFKRLEPTVPTPSPP